MAKCDQVPCAECGIKVYVNWSLMAVILSGEGQAHCVKCALPYVFARDARVKVHDAMRGDLADLEAAHFSSDFIEVIKEIQDE